MGKWVKEVAGRLKRDVLDVEVEVAFKRRVYGGIRRTARRRLRLVAVRLPDSSEYRFYLTNIDLDSLDAHGVAQTHAARWQIELIFKELKSRYRLEELPTRKAHIVETLLLGAVITLLVSRRLLFAVQERLRRTSYKMPEQRWAAIFAAAAPAILNIVVLPPRVSNVIGQRLESMLLHEAPDPNRTRKLLIERVEYGAAGHDSIQLNALTDHGCRTRGTVPVGVEPAESVVVEHDEVELSGVHSLTAERPRPIIVETGRPAGLTDMALITFCWR